MKQVTKYKIPCTYIIIEAMTMVHQFMYQLDDWLVVMSLSSTHEWEIPNVRCLLLPQYYCCQENLGFCMYSGCVDMASL